MKPSIFLLALAAASLFLNAGLPAYAAEEAPRTQTVEEFIDALKPRPAESAPAVRYRGVALGAASQAAAVARPAPRANLLEVRFGFNSDRIAGNSVRNAETLSQALKSPSLKEGRFRVVGHTDAVGSRQSNQRLSQRRANAVREFLVERGVPADHLRAEGRGFDELKNRGNPDADENRRVEIVAEY